MSKMVELLAPAGTLEKLRYAFRYGADAVYLAGERFGLRAKAGNFTMDEIAEGLEIAHSQGKKLYVTVNSYLFDDEYNQLIEYLKDLRTVGPDALIVSDIGVLDVVREVMPDTEIHVSTQANTTSLRAAKVFKSLGATRVILARELSMDRIAEIAREVETEIFVHGAMCMAYSGRCILSAYLTGRSANQGDCTHTCRWKYYLVEEKRQGQYMPVEEDDRGTYIMSPGDLCLLPHLKELMDIGVHSFKIEGRMKSVHYVAAVALAYRLAIDAIQRGEEIPQLSFDLVDSVSHRPFTTGFLFGQPEATRANQYEGTRDFVAVVGSGQIEVKTMLKTGEMLEILTPEGKLVEVEWPEMYRDGEKVFEAHPNWIVTADLGVAVPEMSLVRRKVAGSAHTD